MILLSLINPSLEIVYYSTTLSNRYIIRFIRFVSQFSPRDYEMYFISYPHLTLLISDQTFEFIVAHENLRRARNNEEGTKKKQIRINITYHAAISSLCFRVKVSYNQYMNVLMWNA